MMNTQFQRNKIYFTILFAALAFDLAGRVSSNSTITSADFASVETDLATDQACSKQLKDGLRDSSQGTCQLEVSDTITKAIVKRSTRKKAAKESDGWDTPTTEARSEAPPAPTRTDCSAKVKNKAPTKAAVKACEDKNSAEQRDYETRLAAFKRGEEAKVEHVFEISIQSEAKEAGECADCSIAIDLVMNGKSTPLEVATKIRQTFEAHRKELLKKKEAFAKALKEREAKEKKEAQLKKDIENCVKGDDGKGRSAEDKLQCEVDRLGSLDGKEAREHFNAKIRSSLRQMLESGSDEERTKALAISESIATDSSMPKDVRQVSRVLGVSGKYNDRILKVSADLAKSPEGSAARAFHLQRLAGLNNQMQYEMGSAMYNAQMNGLNGESLDEVMHWMGTLNNSIALAIQNPNNLLDANGLSGRSRLGIDLHVADRWTRGLTGDPLVNRQTDFSGLLKSSNLYIEKQIGTIRDSSAGFTPGSINNGTASFVPATTSALPATDARYQVRARGRANSTSTGIPAVGTHVAN